MENTVTIDPSVETDLKGFRFRKDPSTAALIFKIDATKLMV
jgi:hypothetical protein